MTDERGDAGDDDPNAWERTLDELWAMRDEFEAAGWDVVAMPSAQTVPVTAERGHTDQEGIVFTVPGEHREEFEDAMAAASFDEYEVFRREVGHHLYLLVRVADTDSEVTVLFAGGIDLREADLADVLDDLQSRDAIQTHVRLLDGETLGTFHHEDPSLFFPDWD